MQAVKRDRYPAIFYVIALATPVLFLLILEVALRFYDYDPMPPLFVPAEGGLHLTLNSEVSLRYFDKKDVPPAPREDYFLKDKPEETLRIFLLGGSTAVGWPFAENMMPSRLLQGKLNQTFPEQHIEVVNVAFSAINTYTLLDFVDELLEQSPDLVLIYSGHNEFYGAWGVGSAKSVAPQPWMVRSYLALQHSKVFRLLNNFIGEMMVGDEGELASVTQSSTLMQRMVQQADIPYGGEVYQAGLAQYEGNLRRLIGAFKSAEVEVVISDLVSNLRDQPPFVSSASGDNGTAAEVYAHAQQLEQQQQYLEARDYYRQAKDLDGLRFRAPQQFNHVIEQVAAEYQVAVVPMQRYFEQAAPNGIIGSTLMMEHLHPNVDGYFLFSEAFYDTLRQQRLLRDEWPTTMDHQAFRAAWPVTEYDQVMADLRIYNLKDHWPFRSIEESGSGVAEYQTQSDLEDLALQVIRGMALPLDARRVLAADYESQGDVDSAMRELQAVLVSYPYNVDVYRQAAWLALKHERLDEAQDILLRSLRVEPVAGAHKWLGQIYLRQLNYPAAIAHFEQALELNPNNDDPQLISLLSQSYIYVGEPEKAQQIYERLPDAIPSSPVTSH